MPATFQVSSFEAAWTSATSPVIQLPYTFDPVFVWGKWPITLDRVGGVPRYQVAAYCCPPLHTIAYFSASPALSKCA